MIKGSYNNINTVWLSTLEQLMYGSLDSAPRGMKIKETLGYQTIVDMKHPILSVIKRKLGYKFMFREAWWIINGRNTVHDIKEYSKAISNFSNDGHYFDGAYGPRIVDQLRYVVDSLYNDNDTRQAVMEIWRPNPRDSKDIPCTINIQWLIRDGKIYCIDTMRSSDIWLGWPYDIFNFSMLTAYIVLLLRDRGLNNLELGDIYLNAGSQHLYLSNIDGVNEVIKDVHENDTASFFATEKFNPYLFNNPQELLDCLELCSNMEKPVHYFMEVLHERQTEQEK